MARNAYTLDGVPLTHPQLKYFPEKGTGVRVLPAKRTASITYPGVDGETFETGAPFVPGAVSIRMYVEGTDHEDFMANLEFVNGLFLQRHKLLELRHDYNEAGTNSRHAFVTFSSSAEPSLMDGGAKKATIQYNGTIPGAFWRSSAFVTHTSPATTITPTQIELTALAGGNAPITDALIQVKGAFSAFTITEPTSGDSVTLSFAATATQYFLIDTAKWRVYNTTANSWVPGTEIATGWTCNRGRGSMISFEPKVSSGALKYYLTHSATNPSSSPNVTVRAKKSFL